MEAFRIPEKENTDSLFISVSDQEMNLSVECAADLSPIISSEVTVDKEDGLWLIRTAIGGEDNA